MGGHRRRAPLEIPGPLAEALANVHRMILGGVPESMQESDDLLQTGVLVGGCLNTDEQIYSFDYFADGRSEVWRVVVSAADIRAVVAGRPAILRDVPPAGMHYARELRGRSIG